MKVLGFFAFYNSQNRYYPVLINWNILLIGECKFKNSPFDKTELDKLLEKTKYLPASNPQICIFSLSGFTEEVIKNSGSCRLIRLDDMY